MKPNVVMKNMLEKAYGERLVEYDLAEIAFHMFTGDRFEFAHFLNKKDGSIVVVENNSDECEDMEYDDDYVFMQVDRYDFFREFNHFMKDVSNENFLDEIEKYGHGKGAISRIKAIIRSYPEVEQAWYEYKDRMEQGYVREWLESLGLL